MRVSADVRSLVCAVCLVATAGVSADPAFGVDSSLVAAHIYDSNILAQPTQQESDLSWRISPAIGAKFNSENFDWTGNYSLDAEKYGMHPELDSWQARRRADMGGHYRPVQRLDLSLQGTYLKTNRPGELLPGAGLELGRVQASNLTVESAATFLIDSLTTGYADFKRTRDEIQNGIGTRTDTATLRLGRQVTALDTFSLGYESDLYQFAGFRSEWSRALIAGWDGQLTQLVTASIKIGPRYTAGSAMVDVTAELHRNFASGELSASYRRTQMTVIGLAYPVTTWGWTVNAVYNAGTNFVFRVSPAFARYQAVDTRADVYRFSAEADYDWSQSISVIGTWQYNYERGILGQPGNTSIKDMVIFLGIRFSSQAGYASMTALPLRYRSGTTSGAGL